MKLMHPLIKRPQIHDYLLESDLTFVEVVHHYEPEELQRYDQVIDLEQFV